GSSLSPALPLELSSYRGDALQVAHGHHRGAVRREGDRVLPEPERRREAVSLHADLVARVEMRDRERVEGDLDGLEEAVVQEALRDALRARVGADVAVVDDLDEVARGARAAEPD